MPLLAAQARTAAETTPASTLRGPALRAFGERPLTRRAAGDPRRRVLRRALAFSPVRSRWSGARGAVYGVQRLGRGGIPMWAASSPSGLTCLSYSGLQGVRDSRRARMTRSGSGAPSRWASAR